MVGTCFPSLNLSYSHPFYDLIAQINVEAPGTSMLTKAWNAEPAFKHSRFNTVPTRKEEHHLLNPCALVQSYL